MKNSEILHEANWVIRKDGWWCNPRGHEPTFKTDEVDNLDRENFLNIISATSWNGGCRWKLNDMKNRVYTDMVKAAEKIKKELF